MPMPIESDEDRLQRHLGALPEPALPETLWPRVARARRRQLARRSAVLGAGAAALLALLVLPGAFLHVDAPHPADPATALASTGAIPARAPIVADHDARLRIIDRELQDAYHRGSAQAEIAQLWQARAALLRERTPTMTVRPVRI